MPTVTSGRYNYVTMSPAVSPRDIENTKHPENWTDSMGSLLRVFAEVYVRSQTPNLQPRHLAGWG